MTLTILILVHILFLSKVFDSIISDKLRGVVTAILLTLLCWQENTVWGIVTLCYTFVTLLIIGVVQQLNK